MEKMQHAWSNMLGENAVKIAAQHEYTDAYDFRERPRSSLGGHANDNPNQCREAY